MPWVKASLFPKGELSDADVEAIAGCLKDTAQANGH